MLASLSRDGRVQAGILTRLGFRVVAGSSTRGGASGLRGLMRWMGEGLDGAFAVDGPRGPLGLVKPGVVHLAWRTGATLVPITFFARAARRFDRAWDRYLLPRPFARTLILRGEAIEIPRARRRLGARGRAAASGERAVRARGPGARGVSVSTRVVLGGRLVAPDEARVSVFDRGFLYGDSVYEVLRTYGGRPFALELHLERLERSARLIALEPPFTRAELTADVTLGLARPEVAGGAPDRDCAEAAPPAPPAGAAPDAPDESYVRIVITRGAGEIGLDPALAVDPLRVVIVRPLVTLDPRLYETGARVALVAPTRAPVGASDCGTAKSGNYLPNILALRAREGARRVRGPPRGRGRSGARGLELERVSRARGHAVDAGARRGNPRGHHAPPRAAARARRRPRGPGAGRPRRRAPRGRRGLHHEQHPRDPAGHHDRRPPDRERQGRPPKPAPCASASAP